MSALRGLGWHESSGALSCPDGVSAGWSPPSGWERQVAQSCQGATELVFPGPTLGKMQSDTARRAGEPSHEGEEASPQGLGGDHVFAQTARTASNRTLLKRTLHVTAVARTNLVLTGLRRWLVVLRLGGTIFVRVATGVIGGLVDHNLVSTRHGSLIRRPWPDGERRFKGELPLLFFGNVFR